MNKICLNVLIGIPGAGKTTFCEAFQTYLLGKSSPVKLIHICFDNFITLENRFDLENGCFKQKRKQLLECLERIIEAIKSNDQTCIDQVNTDSDEIFKANFPIDIDLSASEQIYGILLDDNMYYRSMRYEVFALARKHGTGYLQTLFDVPFSEAKARNTTRSNPITEEIISRMWIKLERPSPCFYKWERNTLELLGNLEGFRKLEQAIIECGNSPEKPLDARPEKQPTEQSVAHKLDLLLRKAMGIVIKNHSKMLNDQELKLISNQLIVRKKHILDEFRAGLLEIDPECTTAEQIQQLL